MGRTAPSGQTAAPTAGGESLDVLSLLGGSPMLGQALPVVAGLVLGLLVGNYFASRRTLRAYQEAFRLMSYGPPARRWRGY